jgi:hypothetical protein
MNSEKVPVFKISAPGTSGPSERPSSAFSRHSVASEHGPRSSWSESAVRRSPSPDTVVSFLGTRPVRLFKHQRLCHHGEAALSSIAHVPDTEVAYPKSLHEVEHWLSDVVATAQLTPSDHSSTICLLFMDEDKCKREYHGFSLDRLYAHLKITDWRPSHFQTTFCRFAVPLDVEIEKDDGHGKFSKHHSWDWRFAISHPFDWDMLWAYFPTSRTSVGIVRTWIEGYHADFMDLESMAKSFTGPTLGHPMLLGLFAIDIVTRDSMAAVRQKGEQLWQAQKVTGYNHFPHQSNKRLIMTEEDDQLAADIGAQTSVVMGAAINLTAWIHAATQLAGFSAFIRSEGERFKGSYFSARDPGFARLATYIDQHALKQVGDLDGAHYDTSAWLDTARFLLQGVLNLAAQRDSAINIQLARDSQKIAEDSKRDSTSTMSLAMVAMLFLPGTYTAVSCAPLAIPLPWPSGAR